MSVYNSFQFLEYVGTDERDTTIYAIENDLN